MIRNKKPDKGVSYNNKLTFNVYIYLQCVKIIKDSFHILTQANNFFSLPALFYPPILVWLILINTKLFYYMINQFRRLVLKMADNQKRVLRDRKHHNYLATEIVDGQTLGYVRPGFGKEQVSSAVELNSNAKHLVRFINQINKKLKEHEMKDEAEELLVKAEEPQNMQRETNKSLNSQTGAKKERLPKKQNHEDPIGRERPGQSNGPKNEDKRISKPQKQIDSWLKNNFPPKMGVSVGLNNEPFFREGNGLNMKGIGSHEQEFFSKFVESTKRQIQLNDGMNRQILRERQRKSEPKDRNKLFGRSAYHIAIAYHIHLETIKKEKNNSLHFAELDPTYHSKKLKEQGASEE